MAEELAKTLRRIGPASAEIEEALRRMAVAMAKKINHAPIAFLKRRVTGEEAGMRFVTLARSMFDLDNEPVPDDAHLGRKKKRNFPPDGG